VIYDVDIIAVPEQAGFVTEVRLPCAR